MPSGRNAGATETAVGSLVSRAREGTASQLAVMRICGWRSRGWRWGIRPVLGSGSPVGNVAM